MKTKEITIPLARLSYPHLFEPSAPPGGASKYSLALLIPKGSEEDKLISSTIKELADQEYGDKAQQQLTKFAFNEMKNVYFDGDMLCQMGKGQELSGHMRLKANNKIQPTLVRADGTLIDPAKATGADRDLFVEGNYVLVKVILKAMTGEPFEGIRGEVTGVQFARHGEKLGSSGKRADPNAFAALTEGADAEELI